MSNPASQIFADGTRPARVSTTSEPKRTSLQKKISDSKRLEEFPGANKGIQIKIVSSGCHNMK